MNPKMHKKRKKKKIKFQKVSTTLSMLQITKASEVVPISVYLWGIFFHGGQFQLKPTSSDRTPSPETGPRLSNSSTRSPVRTPSTFWLSLIFWVSLILQKTLNSNRSLGGKKPIRRGLSEDSKTQLRELGLCWERENKLSALIARLSIFFGKEERKKNGVWLVWKCLLVKLV